MSVVHRSVVVLACSLLLLTASAQAQEQVTKEACIEAYEGAQELRLEGKLQEARDKATFCAQPACPDAVVSGCTKWVGELARAMPSIVVTVRGADGDRSDVKVWIDGVLVAEKLDGRAIELDPGDRIVKIEPSGEEAVTRKLVIAEGVKSRSIVVDLESPTSVPAGGHSSEPTAQDRGTPVGPIVLGALALASFGTFAGLAAVGSADVGEMEDTCRPNCSQDRIDDAKTKLLVGDIFLFSGIALTGGAVGWLLYHYLSEPEGDVAAGLELVVTPRGGFAGMTLRF